MRFRTPRAASPATRRGLAALCALGLAAPCAAPGCAGGGGGPADTPRAAARDRPASPEERLARVGLEVLGEREANIPPPERGRYLPCRVIPGRTDTVLPPDPAGYLIVSVEGRPEGRVEDILRALSRWEPGDTLTLKVRRNTYLAADPAWYEVDVPMKLPAR